MKLKNKVEYLLKHNAFIQKTYKVCMGGALQCLGLFIKTDPNLVLINALGGKRFGDSPKAIYDYLRGHAEFNHLRLVWAFDDPAKFDTGCETIKMDTLAYFKTALKAKYWISSVNIERGLNFKKKATRYLNTWHGIPLKFIGNDCPGRKDYDMSYIDYFCYSGSFEYEIYQQAFQVKSSSMLLSGLPRNDELYRADAEKSAEIRKRLNIPEGKKVLLYAPTWRESEDGGKTYNLAPPVDFKKWEKELGEEYVLLFRAHHFTTQHMKIEFNDFVRDTSDYPAINDLMIASDILISDYSATIFDYCVLERPIISFAYDYEDFKETRGLYVDLPTELPCGIVKTEEDVIESIKKMDFAASCERTRVFKNKYVPTGGSATEICVKALFGDDVTEI